MMMLETVNLLSRFLLEKTLHFDICPLNDPSFQRRNTRSIRKNWIGKAQGNGALRLRIQYCGLRWLDRLTDHGCQLRLAAHWLSLGARRPGIRMAKQGLDQQSSIRSRCGAGGEIGYQLICSSRVGAAHLATQLPSLAYSQWRPLDQPRNRRASEAPSEPAAGTRPTDAMANPAMAASNRPLKPSDCPLK